MTQRVRRGILLGVGLLAAAVFFYKTHEVWRGIASVLGLGGGFALVLTPTCSWLERRGIRRSTASLISVGVLIGLLLIFLMSFVPYLVAHAIDLIRRMTPTLNMMLTQGQACLSRWGLQLKNETSLTQMLTSAAAPLTTGIARGGAALALGVGNLVMVMVIAYYLLCVRRQMGCYLLLLVPTAYRRALLCAVKGCKNAVLGYLSGLMKTSLFVGGATFVGLLLLGIKESLILSLFMAILEVLPYIGPVLGAVPIVLCAIPLGLGKALLALALVVLIQQIEGSVISPYFTASSTSIHPFSAILCVYIGGSLFGLAGIMLAVPAIITLRSALWSMRSAAIQTDS